MTRARGSDAFCDIKTESSYGTPPSGNWTRVPFVSSDMGKEQGLLESDLLGLGREGLDPARDVVNNRGNHVVPVDVRNFGHWLRLFFGAPTTTGTDPYTHVFASGAASLPSISMQLGLPAVPHFGVNYGIRGNTMQVRMQRSGLLSATLGLIAKGENRVTSTASGTPTSVVTERFAQATGEITREGAALGGIVSADFTFSNGLDPVETIQPDGEIEDIDPGMATFNANVVARFADTTLLGDATSGDPIEMSFGWEKGAHSLIFAVPRVFLPVPKMPISGPGGVQANFNIQASGEGVVLVTATLINDVASYA